MTSDEVAQLKDVEYYAAGVNAYYNTSMEYDKSIFALSAGGVGLLITLLTTVGVQSKLILTLYGAAIICFLVSLVALLVIFRRNKKHIEDVLVGRCVLDDPILKKLDLVTINAFGLGAAFAAVVGISSAINSYEGERKKMATNKEPNPNTALLKDVRKSFNGVERLQNSFNGIGRVSPNSGGDAPTPTPTATPTPAPTPAAPPTTGSGGSSGT